MQIYNTNITNINPGVQGYLKTFKSMFLPMLYANVHLRPNWDQVEEFFNKNLSVVVLGESRQRKRSRNRKTRKTRKTRR
jgi:hypothetical protein